MRASNTATQSKVNAATSILHGQWLRHDPLASAKKRLRQFAMDLEQAVVNNDVSAAESALKSFREVGGALDLLKINCDLGEEIVSLNIIELTYFHESKDVFLFLWAELRLWHRPMAESFLGFLRQRVNQAPSHEPLPKFDAELLMILACPRDLNAARSVVDKLSSREIEDRFYVEFLRLVRLAMAKFESEELELVSEQTGSSKRAKARL